MPLVVSRAEARAACAVVAGSHIRVLLWRGLLMLPAMAIALLLLATETGEGTAMPTHLRPFALAGVYSGDFAGFPKWRGMLARFSHQLAEPADARAWYSLVGGLGDGDRLAQLRAVNTAINAFPYAADVVKWGRADFWETPIEFLRHGGDCEDYAIAKYMALQALGVAVADMRVAVVDEQILGVTHAVLLVADSDRYYLLDNLNTDVVPVTEASAYRPIYAINERGWWNYGPPRQASAAAP